LKKKQTTAPDWPLLVLTAGLMAFGWVTLYSASALISESRYGDQYYFLKRQMMWSGIGLAGMLVAFRLNLAWLQRYARLIFVGVVILLGCVLVFGYEVGGSRRWLRIAGLGFQPSEFAKLGLVIILADYLDRKQSRLKEFWPGFVPPMVLMGLVVGLIALEPDLGTPLLIVFVGVGMVFMAGARLAHLAAVALASLPLLYFQIFRVPYRRQRVLAFLDPWSDTQGAAYQLVQSFLALGSGGFWGRGAGESLMKMHYLPESQTDFVFSILGEELGFIGAGSLIAVFALLVYRGFRIAARASNWFEWLLASGISLLLGGQVLINLGVVTGLLPTKGIPLPLISFGGSSLAITLVSIGLLMNVSQRTSSDVLAEGRVRRS
jgi:cell division protein FtsW